MYKFLKILLGILLLLALTFVAVFYVKPKLEELTKPKQTYFLNEQDKVLWDSIGESYKQDKTTDGLDPRVAKLKVFMEKKFNIKQFSLYRPGDPEDHGKGLAIDLMVYKDEEKGDEIAEYLVQNFDNLGLSYIIWEQKFYMDVRNKYGAAKTWNLMEDRGSITANHYDHVHISFKNYENKS